MAQSARAPPIARRRPSRLSAYVLAAPVTHLIPPRPPAPDQKRFIVKITTPFPAQSTAQALSPEPRPTSTPSIAPRKTDSNPLARWLQTAAHEQAQRAVLAREREQMQQAAARYAAD